ncbi:MAG: hypothetical protein WBA42_07075 [Mesorhizobium sp.]
MVEMLVGRVLVPDISNPRPEDVDVEFMRMRLATIRRFNGHVRALYVAQHQRLCGALAEHLGYGPAVVEWSEHHDDHEYFTGDIATPLQVVIGMTAIRSLQARWDIAIRGALGIEEPTDETRRLVAVVDAIALAMEWRCLLRRDIAELGVSEPIATLAEHHAGLIHEAFLG